ncbi:MAG: PBECR4 domain-containing protein [Christensenellaceae bacterium]
MEDKLYNVAKYYKDHLENRRFLLVAAKKDKIISLEILFRPEDFKHLSGLHKLEDIGLKSISSEMLFTRILNKELSYNHIKDSIFFNVMQDRLDNFQKIGTLLSSPEDLRKSLYGTFGYGRGITADYLLSRKEEGNFIHLFLKEKGDVVLPVTFFTEETEYYLRNNAVRWNIVDIDEIQEKDDKHRKAKIAELKAKLELQTGKSMKELQEEVRKFHGRTDEGRSQGDEHDR